MWRAYGCRMFGSVDVTQGKVTDPDSLWVLLYEGESEEAAKAAAEGFKTGYGLG